MVDDVDVSLSGVGVAARARRGGVGVSSPSSGSLEDFVGLTDLEAVT
jgi:hypothetical protein